MPVHSNMFREVLRAKRIELLAIVANRDDIRIENAAEDFDRLQQSTNRDVAIQNLDRGSRILKSIEDALCRIGAGEFGKCLRCEEEISEKRLKAVPWASHCLSCQEKFDRRPAMGELEDGSDKPVPAA